MGAGRVFGGILALIGSVLLVIPVLMHLGSYSGSLLFIILLVVAILAFVGSILAVANKRGVLALIMGIVLLVLCILPYIYVTGETFAFAQMLFWCSGWEIWIMPSVGFSFMATIYITFETIMIFLGGLIATIASE